MPPSPRSHSNPATAVYMRCSSRTQETASQRHQIDEYLLHNPVVGRIEWYVDEAATGTHMDRQQLRRLHHDIVSGSVDTVIIWRLDRLSRSMTDGIKLLGSWTGRDVRIISLKEQLDLAGPVGRMVAALLLGVAEMEKEHLRERQAAGIAKARKNGVRFGRPRIVDPSRVCSMKKRGLAVIEISRRMKISRQSVYNALRKDR